MTVANLCPRPAHKTSRAQLFRALQPFVEAERRRQRASLSSAPPCSSLGSHRALGHPLDPVDHVSRIERAGDEVDRPHDFTDTDRRENEDEPGEVRPKTLLCQAKTLLLGAGQATGVLRSHLGDKLTLSLPIAPNRLAIVVVVHQRGMHVSERKLGVRLNDLVGRHPQVLRLTRDLAHLHVRSRHDRSLTRIVDVWDEPNRWFHRRPTTIALSRNPYERGA
jgi:hypothetical protein